MHAKLRQGADHGLLCLGGGARFGRKERVEQQGDQSQAQQQRPATGQSRQILSRRFHPLSADCRCCSSPTRGGAGSGVLLLLAHILPGGVHFGLAATQGQQQGILVDRDAEDAYTDCVVDGIGDGRHGVD